MKTVYIGSAMMPKPAPVDAEDEGVRVVSEAGSWKRDASVPAELTLTRSPGSASIDKLPP